MLRPAVLTALAAFGQSRNFTPEEILDLLDVRLAAGVALERLEAGELDTAKNIIGWVVGRLDVYTPRVRSERD
jgi:GAF domain-containing protein